MTTLLPHLRDRVSERHMDANAGTLDDAEIPHHLHGRFPAYLDITTVSSMMTGATAGVPGTVDPVGCALPADLAELISYGAMGETTVWTVGQYIVLGDGSSAHWGGSEWTVGAAPA